MYIVRFTTGNTPKNKLQTAALEYLQKLDRIIIQDEDLDKFEKQVLDEIQRLHDEEFPRCGAVPASFWSNNAYHAYEQEPKCKDRKISGVEFANLHLMYAEKKFSHESRSFN